jgi:hypothetical protein
VQFGGTTTESIELGAGTHTVVVGAYATAAGVSVGTYTFTYRLYQE